ncbi:MAG: class I SAM-dependent methyltransferase [Tepidisphaerales bacterium]
MPEIMPTIPAPRRTGDRIAIGGNYQHRAITAGPAPQRFWHEAKLREAMRWLDPQPGDVMLDVGCGSGVLADRLAAVEGTRVIGVDGNAAAIEFASAQYQRPNLEFRHGLVDELGFAPGSISKIAFLEVIEHIPTPQGLAVLQSFHKLLRPGGRAVISTPNIRSLWPVIEWAMDAFRLAPHMAEDQHVAYYHRGSLARLGEAAGFRVAGCRTINFAAPWLAWINWRLAERVHARETARNQPLGSIVVMAFEKPVAATADRGPSAVGPASSLATQNGTPK